VNGSEVNYTCYEKLEDWSSWADAITFWLRGIIPAIISTLGIIFNSISFIVLRKCEGDEIFKKLLMSLGIKQKIVLSKILSNDMSNQFQLALIAFTCLIRFVTIYIGMYCYAKEKLYGVQL
jgi:hypothetical protein